LARRTCVNRAAVLGGLTQEESEPIEHKQLHALGARLTLIHHLIEDQADVFERSC